jgi:ubiquinone/menaquinone biosynthesis C-methylase UbiE
MVDIGGGAGFVATAVAKAAPELRIMVQDQEKPIAHGRRTLPEDLKERVEFVEADFFKPQTMEADVYFLRMIVCFSLRIVLHTRVEVADWSLRSMTTLMIFIPTLSGISCQ